MKIALLEQRLAAQRAGRTTVLVTDLESGAQILLGDGMAAGDLVLGHEDRARINGAVLADRSEIIDRPGGRLFVEVWSPPLRLILVGAVHIAQALARMGRETGYDVTIIDPRSAFATADRFPDVTLNAAWPDEALPALAPDKRTAIVTLTHDPKIDDPGLHAALRSDAFYIGALGSRRTHARRVERLMGAGFGADVIARIHAPVGLDIGALTPGEIAVSILAEMTAILRRERIKSKMAPGTAVADKAP